MKFRVYIEIIDAGPLYKKREIKFINNNWHNVISIWFDGNGAVITVTIPYKGGVTTIFSSRAKIKLEMDGNIIWEN